MAVARPSRATVLRHRLGEAHDETGGLRLTADGYIGSPPNWTIEEFESAVSEAHARRAIVVAHATSDTGIRLAVRGGLRFHRARDLIGPRRPRRWRRRAFFSSPTLTVLMYVAEPGRAKAGRSGRRRRRSWRSRSRAAARRACRIAFGIYAGGFPCTEINQAKEFEHEVAFGMSPLEAIAARRRWPRS